MDHEGYPPGQLGQLARRLVRISALTRVFGVLAILVGGLFMMYGLSRMDRRMDDAVGFGSVGLTAACVGAIVWGMGAYHAAFGRSLTMVASIDDRLGDLLAVFRRLEQRAAQPVVAAPSTPVGSPGDARVAAHPENGQASAPSVAVRAPEPAPPPRPIVPEARLCLRCGETLRPDVTRCRVCMTKVDA